MTKYYVAPYRKPWQSLKIRPLLLLKTLQITDHVTINCMAFTASPLLV